MRTTVSGDLDAAAREKQRFHDAWTFRAQDSRSTRIDELVRTAAEAPNLDARNAAVEGMRAALALGDNAAVLDAARDFLEAPPIEVPDERRQAVLDLYARAFTTWFVELDGPLDAAAEQRVGAYQKLAAPKDVGEVKS